MVFELKDGVGPEYEIEAGEALKEFSRRVYKPLAAHQSVFFGDFVKKQLVLEGEAS